MLEKQAVRSSLQRAAAVCYRRINGRLDFLLVRTSSLLYRIFPKGKVEAGEELWAAAEREAFEEAGVKGKIRKEPLMAFPYPRDGQEVPVTAFLLEVETVEPAGEEFRTPVWYKPEQARAALSKNRQYGIAAVLCAVVDKACAVIDSQQ